MSFIFPDKNSNLNYNEYELYFINAIISENKKITEIYTSTYNDLLANGTIIPNDIIIKEFSPFTWFCKKKDLIDMSIITFIWKNKDIKYNSKKIHNPYFNGYMFGYKDEDIKQHYVNTYSYDDTIEKALEYYEEDKHALNNSLEYCKNLIEYQKWIEKYYPEIN